MSKKVQRSAADRRDAARERAENARQRAVRQRDLGDSLLARLHDESAVAQDAAADAAEAQRLADVAIEGDQLRPN
jgi:hypothetical protein